MVDDAVAEMSDKKSVKKSEPLAHVVDDMDFMEAGNVDVARGPFAAHIDKSDISVRQVSTHTFFLAFCVDSASIYIWD